MRVIGITGGVGAGKTTVLTYIEQRYNAKVIYADRLAEQLIEPGTEGYKDLINLLGDDIINASGQIDRRKMASKIFGNEQLLQSVNEIIHPAVKKSIRETIDTLRKQNTIEFLFIEAALLIEDGYKNIVDELWYIYADETSRRKRLIESRSYSDDKINSIMKNQLSDSEFRKQCDVIINNSGDSWDSEKQIDKLLGERK